MESDDARERGIDWYAGQLVEGRSHALWLEDEYRERLLGDWGDTPEGTRDYGGLLMEHVRARDWDGVVQLARRVAEEVASQHYERIMSEAAEAAAEELVDDESAV